MSRAVGVAARVRVCLRVASAAPTVRRAWVAPQRYASTQSQKAAGNSASGSASDAGPLRFVAEAVYIPEASKVAQGREGEDAHFTTAICVGASDGVGGYSELGIDAGVFARKVMSTCRDAALDEYLAMDPEDDGRTDAPEFPVDPLRILKQGLVGAKGIQGAATAVLVSAGQRGRLSVLNLGDSGAQLWRYAAPVAGVNALPPGAMRVEEAAKLWSCEAETSVQQHAWNTPYQMSAGPRDDPPEAGDRYAWRALPGDIVILFTDGVSDNVYTKTEFPRLLAKFDMRPCTSLVRMRRVSAAAVAAPSGEQATGTVLESRKLLAIAKEEYTPIEKQQAEKDCRAQLRALATMIADVAARIGRDQKAKTPFSDSVPRQRYVGGKQDDVTVVVALVTTADA